MRVRRLPGVAACGITYLLRLVILDVKDDISMRCEPGVVRIFPSFSFNSKFSEFQY
jgi:hypothetical protein